MRKCVRSVNKIGFIMQRFELGPEGLNEYARDKWSTKENYPLGGFRRLI